MKGTVFKYGAQGDPLLRPENGGRIVILTGYPERPKIGSTVEYDITRQSHSVDYGVLRQTQPQKPASERRQVAEVSKNPLEGSLDGIQALWDESFAEHMTDKGRAAFPRVLQDIRERYDSGDRQGAAKIAHEGYEWALWETEGCEVSPVGWNYMTMARQFESLERLIRLS